MQQSNVSQKTLRSAFGHEQSEAVRAYNLQDAYGPGPEVDSTPEAIAQGRPVPPRFPFLPHHTVTRSPYHSNLGDYLWHKEFPQGIWLEEDIPEMLKKLSARQRTYVTARVRGETRAQACVRIGRAKQGGSPRAWEEAPWWEVACDLERQRIWGNVDTHLLTLMPQTLARLAHELTGDAGDEIAHQTAIWIAEKLGGKPTQRTVTQTQRDPQEQQASLANDLVSVLRALPDVMASMQGAVAGGGSRGYTPALSAPPSAPSSTPTDAIPVQATITPFSPTRDPNAAQPRYAQVPTAAEDEDEDEDSGT